MSTSEMICSIAGLFVLAMVIVALNRPIKRLLKICKTCRGYGGSTVPPGCKCPECGDIV